jgi:hypothetical protein
MHTRRASRPAKPSTDATLAGALSCVGRKVPATRIVAVDARETHRQPCDGRRPSGKRRSRWVPINPKGRTHTIAEK